MSSPPFKVRAVFEYTSPHEDDLHFPNGQIITVTEEEDEDWYVGEYVDSSGAKQEGIFPRNFVERYEPTAPPRPVRASRPKKEAEPAPASIPQTENEPEQEPGPEPEETHPEPVAREPSPEPLVSNPPPPKAPEISSPPRVPKAVPSSKASAPPPVSDKPSGGSFRDRIAAFNKAAPPVAPFKPGGLGSGASNSFIKKPFVAPPPSKNAYVPPPREPVPQKVYRRDEDPEITAKETENLEQAERAGLAPSTNIDAEEQPKPTSLKERIALLQKQQAEQAARHADAVAKKEKPKRPAKKRTESHEAPEGAEEGESAVLERRDTQETVGKASMDSLREEHTAPRRRKSSKGAATTPSLHPRKSFGDGNEADMSGAGDTTEEPEEMSTERDSDEHPRYRPPPPPARGPSAPAREPNVGEEEGASDEEVPADEGEEEEEEEEEEDDIDPEVRRKEELRARMAKMSGGMGMHGMFGAMAMPMSAPPKKKKSTGVSERSAEEHGDEAPSPSTRAPPVPMIPMPGMSKVRSPEELNKQLHEDEDPTSIFRNRPADEVPDVEDVVSDRGSPPPVPFHSTTAPPIPGGRPGPPPVPQETRPVPPHPTNIRSPSAGSESDDELSERTHNLSVVTPTAEVSRAPSRPPQPPGSPLTKRASYFGAEEISPPSPTTSGNNKERRTSRVPPIPGHAPVTAPQTRAPPPPPPGASLSRASTGDHHILPPQKSAPSEPSDEEEVTEYEGDYDTDIASATPHKDALKAHARDSSLDEPVPVHSPLGLPPSMPPPPPSSSAPRAIPPPLPSQPPPNSRHSSDMPRAAPPPPPPAKMPAPLEQDDGDEYDPYKYTAPPPVPKPSAPSASASTPRLERTSSDLYSSSPPRSYASPHLQERAAPPPPPRESAPPSSNRAPPRHSMDINRSATNSRRSADLGRMSMDVGFVANDVDLGKHSFWWTQARGIPPVFQGRKDILYEIKESNSQEGATTVATKELFVLFQDYSQTIITAQFAADNPADVQLEQRHEPPPSRVRQDQLEDAHEQFGRRIFEAVTSKRETVVGDGTPQGLVQELLKPFADALRPVGTRGYGAIVYGNLANASTQQNDEIRPGDIITLRNAKFQGKHGPMHAKYSMDVGKPDHVGVVAEWDGTKKKVRAWEQGRESKKVKLESFKLDDLRSGEVKIWRVMPRSWVGWEGQN